MYLQIAFLSGVAAALASVFAKLASQTDPGGLVYLFLCQWVTRLNCLHEPSVSSPAYQLYQQVSFRKLKLKYIPFIRIGFVGCVVLSNAIMWILFTRALAKAPASLHVTTMNTAANMATTVRGFIIKKSKRESQVGSCLVNILHCNGGSARESLPSDR